MVQIKSVGVIGAGQMGTGIAHVVALGGYDVLLHDVSAERLEAGLGLIEKNMSRQVVRGVIKQEAMDAAIRALENEIQNFRQSLQKAIEASKRGQVDQELQKLEYCRDELNAINGSIEGILGQLAFGQSTFVH